MARSRYYKTDGPTARLERTGVSCTIPGCMRAVFRKGLCTAHMKRLQRKKPVAGPIGVNIMTGEMLTFKQGEPAIDEMSTEERTLIAGDAWLQCSAEDDKLYAYRRHAFLKAAASWLEGLGWIAPPNAARKLRKGK